MIRIHVDDLEAILDEELSNGIPSSDWNKIARHRRLTHLLVEAQNKSRAKQAKKERKERKKANANAVARFVHCGHSKIPVIKLHRAHFGSGLREAKLWAEGNEQCWPFTLTDGKFAQDLEEAGAEIDWIYTGR